MWIGAPVVETIMDSGAKVSEDIFRGNVVEFGGVYGELAKFDSREGEFWVTGDCGPDEFFHFLSVGESHSLSELFALGFHRRVNCFIQAA